MATPKQARYIGRLLYWKGKQLQDACKLAGCSYIATRPGDLSFEDCSKIIGYLKALPTDRPEASKPDSAPDYDPPSPSTMKRQELVSFASDKLSFPRGTMMRATGESILKALEAADTNLLRDISGKPLTIQDLTVPPPSPQLSGDLAQMIAHAIRPHLDLAQSEMSDVLMAELEERLSNLRTPVVVEVKHPDGKIVNVGRQHTAFPMLVKLASAGLPVYLKGPAGSGKTTAAEKLAEALNLPFYVQSMGPQTSQSQLLGYMDAHGKYVAGFLRQPFEHGGVCCLDEIDNSNPSVLTILNSALSNGYCSFPDGMVKRSDKCIFVVSGNTFGTGADALYVGRMQLDAATLDRFAVLDWPIDEEFEADLAHSTVKALDCKWSDTFEGWLSVVRKVRATVSTLKIRMVVSPRATLYGVRLLSEGIEPATVENIVLWKGVGTDDRTKVQNAMGRA